MKDKLTNKKFYVGESIKFYTAKYDRVFKSIFCDELNKHMFLFLLSKLLNRNVSDFIFLRNELNVDNINSKVKVLDVLALVDGEYVHIELNIIGNTKYTHIRNFIYFSEVFNKRTIRGEKYDYKTEFIHIDLSYGINNKELETVYYIMSDNKEKYIDNIKIIEFDMDKLDDVRYNNDERFKYLKMLDMTIEELMSNFKGDEYIMEYRDKLKKLNEDEIFISSISYEDDQRYMLNTEREIGFDDGLEQGIEQNQKDIVLNMYNTKVSIEDISKYTNISIEKVNEIISNK